jgi:hypothetical protein
MNEKLKQAYKSLEWIYDKVDELSARVNDYIFFSGCDIGLAEVDIKKLKAFDKECNELRARYNKELREIERIELQ